MFIDDYSVDSMFHAIILRSPLSHGSLVEIFCLDLPEPYVLITAKDIPGINELDNFSIPILASEYLSYIGEPVGILAGPDLTRLDEIASNCIVKVNEYVQETRKESLLDSPSFKRISYSSNSSKDSETRELPQLIASGTYETGIQEHWYSESQGAAADFTKEMLTVHTSTQWPFNVQRSLSKMLKIPVNKIEVIQTEPGLHLDGKIMFPSLISCQAALASFITKKPVRLKLSRTEDFRFTPKRSGSETHIVSALDQNGRIINTEIITAIDIGSQETFTNELLNQICLGSLGMYKLGHINLEGIALKTNKPPQGPMEGFGISQGFFALERHVSRLAESLMKDPAEWRKQNSLKKNDKLAIGIPLKEDVPMTKLIDSVAEMSDYYRKWASYELLKKSRKKKWELNEHEIKRGIGIAAAYQGSGFLCTGRDKGAYGVELILGKDSSLEIKTSIIPNSKENEKIWRGLAGSILGVEEGLVSITTTDKDIDSGPDCLSRSITVITGLVEQCCQEIRKLRFRDPLPITVKRNIKPEKLLAWNLTKEDGKNSECCVNPLAFNSPSWGAAVAEIEIDNISLQPIILGVWMVADGGRILSLQGAKRSLKLGIINALSWTINEQVIYKNGEIPPNIIDNYKLFAPVEIAPIHIDFLKNDNAKPKGIGELPYSCIPAAYSQAVSQALDHPFEKIPLTAEDLWDVMKNKTAEIPV